MKDRRHSHDCDLREADARAIERMFEKARPRENLRAMSQETCPACGRVRFLGKEEMRIRALKRRGTSVSFACVLCMLRGRSFVWREDIGLANRLLDGTGALMTAVMAVIGTGV